MAHSAQIKLSTVLPVILLIVGIIIGFAVGFAVRPPAPTPTATPSPSPTVKVIKVAVWASGSPVDVTRVDNIERAANILNRMFEAAGAPVRIEVEKQFFRGDYMEKLTAAFAAGEAPDIIAMKNLPVLADGGYIIALDDYVEKYKDLLEDVYPVLWNAVKYKGKIWALPQDTEARPLYLSLIHI